MINLTLVLFFLCFSVSAHMFVVVDWANVRENPHSDARRITVLPYGTRCHISEEKNGWVHVSRVDHPNLTTIGNTSGWVSSSLVDSTLPHYSREPITQSDSLNLLRRCAVTFDSCRTALHRYYKERNDEVGLARWHELYDSTHFRPIYIAIKGKRQDNTPGEVEITGVIEAKDSLTPLYIPISVYDDCVDESTEKDPIMAHIQAIRQKLWYSHNLPRHKNFLKSSTTFFAPGSYWRCNGISLGTEEYGGGYSLFASEAIDYYFTKVDSFTLPHREDIQIALQMIYKCFKGWQDVDSSLIFSKHHIESATVTPLQFGYREITLTGNLIPSDWVSLSEFKIIVDKKNRVVWPTMTIDNEGTEYCSSGVYLTRGFSDHEVDEQWFSFENIPESLFRVIPVVGPNGYVAEGKGTFWGYQILRLSPEGLFVLGERYEDS